VVFAVCCLVISWGLWLAAGLTGADVTTSPTIWLFALGASGPSLAALVAVIVVRGSDPGVRRRIAPPWLWLPLALVLGAAPAVLASMVLDPGGLGAEAGATVAASGGVLLFVVTYLIAGPLAEEFGWRGYVQPRLRTRFGILATAGILGTAWAVWHVPLFFLPGTGQEEMGLFTVRGLVFMVTLLPLSVTYLFLSEALGGGVWAAVLLHFAGNAAGALFPEPSVAGAVIQLVVVVVIAAASVTAWRRLRVVPFASPTAAAASSPEDREVV
jgi:membrane protease YdiL (CAAX protease family)